MTTNQTIDGVPRELIERVTKPLTIHDDLTDRIKARDELRALLDAPAKAEFSIPDCPDCACVQDGQCLCIPSKPAAQPQGEPVAIDDNVEFEKWWMSTPILRKQKIQIAQEAWFARAKLAEQPEPVAAALPERVDPDYFDSVRETGIGWNACLDELKRLNPSL